MKVISIILALLVLNLAGIAYYFYHTSNKMQAELENSRNTNTEFSFQVKNLQEQKAKVVSELE